MGLYTRGTLVSDDVIGSAQDQPGVYCRRGTAHALWNRTHTRGSRPLATCVPDPRGQFIMCLWEQEVTGRWGRRVKPTAGPPPREGTARSVHVAMMAFDCSTCTLVFDEFKDNALRSGELAALAGWITTARGGGWLTLWLRTRRRYRVAPEAHVPCGAGAACDGTE